MNPSYLDQVYDDIAAVYGDSFNTSREEVAKALLEDKNYVQHIWSELSKNEKSNLVRNEADINAFFSKIQNTKLKDVAPAYTAEEERKAKVLDDAEEKEESIEQNGILDNDLNVVDGSLYSPYDNDETPAATDLRKTVANYADPTWFPNSENPEALNLGENLMRWWRSDEDNPYGDDDDLAARRKLFNEATIREDYNTKIQIERERELTERTTRRQKAQLSNLAKYELNLGISGDIKFFSNGSELLDPAEKAKATPGEWKTKDKYLYANDEAYKTTWDNATEFNIGDETLGMLKFIDNAMSSNINTQTSLVEKAQQSAWATQQNYRNGFSPAWKYDAELKNAVAETLNEFYETDEGYAFLEEYTAKEAQETGSRVEANEIKIVGTKNPELDEEEIVVKASDNILTRVANNAGYTADEFMYNKILDTTSTSGNVADQTATRAVEDLREVRATRDAEIVKYNAALQVRAEEIFNSEGWPQTKEGQDAAFIEASQGVNKVQYSKELSTALTRLQGANKRFIDQGVIPIVDINGNWVSQNRRDQDTAMEAKSETNMADAQILAAGPTGPLLDQLQAVQNEIVSLGIQLGYKKKGSILRDASVFQQVGEFFGGNLNADIARFEKLLEDPNVKLVDPLYNKNALFSPVPGGSIIADKYNEALSKYMVLSAAYGLNYDPLSTAKSSFGDGNGFGNEFLQGVVDATPETLDIFDVDDNERARIFADQLENKMGYKLSDSEDSRIEMGAGESMGSMVPALTKMGIEIGVTSLILGPSVIANISRVAGEAVELGIVGARMRLPMRAAWNSTSFMNTSKYIGRWANMTIHESVGLMGSNFLGSNLNNSEEMPVFSFAAGSALGRLGFKGLSKIGAPYFDDIYRSMKQGNNIGSKTVRVLEDIRKKTPSLIAKPIGAAKGITRSALTKGGEAGVGVLAIKAGEVTSGLYDVSTGQVEFKEFWKHTTDPESFQNLFGTLVFMGAAGRGGMKSIYENVKKDMDIMTNGKNTARANQMASFLGIKRKINEIKGNDFEYEFVSEQGLDGSKTVKRKIPKNKNTFSDAEIDAAVAQKKKNIIDQEDWNPAQGSKADAMANLDFMANKLKMHRTVAETRLNSDFFEDLAFGENSITRKFNSELDRLSSGKYDQDGLSTYTIGETANAAGPEYVSQEIQAATGMAKVDAENMVKSAQTATKAVDNAGFKNSPNKGEFLDSVILDIELSKRKEKLKKDSDKPDGMKKKDIAEVDAAIEANSIRQSEIIDTQKKYKKEKAKEEKERLAKEIEVVELAEGETIDGELGKLGFEITDSNVQKLDYGVQVVNPKTGKTLVMYDTAEMYDIGNIFNSKKTGAAGTIVHEGVHPISSRYTNVEVLKSQIKKQIPEITDKEATVQAEEMRNDFIEDFVDVLKETGEYEAVLVEMKTNADFNPKKPFESDEWFSVYGEMVKEGKFDFGKKERKAFDGFKNKLNNFFGKTDLKINWESGFDAYNWVKAFAEGDISLKTLEYKEGIKQYEEVVAEIKKGVEPSYNAIKRDAKDVMFDFYNEVTDFRSNLDTKLRSGISKEQATSEAIKEAQEKWDNGGSTKFIEKLYKDGILNRLILSYIPIEKPPGWLKEKTTDPITGKEIEAGDAEFIITTFTELIPHIRNFKIGKQPIGLDQNLFAWVNSQLSNKVGNVFKFDKMGTKEKFDTTYDQMAEAGISEPSVEMNLETEVREIKTAEDLFTDLNIDNRVGKKLILDTESIDFSKLPDVDAPMGKNQRISPFIREFKKEAGSKLGKTIYEDVLKKGKNPEWLSENYSDIVRSLDLGYLAKNFSFLVEKRVDGSYTTEWKGKEIDTMGGKEGFTSNPEYIRLNPEFNTELNKSLFVETLTDFSKASNPSSARAAKQKALAYQLGDVIAIAKFREQTNIAMEAKSELSDINSEIQKVKENSVKYSELKAEHPEWTTQRLKRETDGVTPNNYFDKLMKLREKALDEKMKIEEQPVFKAFEESSTKELDLDTSTKIDNSIEKGMFRRSSVIKKLPLEDQAEMFSKFNEAKEWFKDKKIFEKNINMNSDVVWKNLIKDVFDTELSSGFRLSDAQKVKLKNDFKRYFKIANENLKGRKIDNKKLSKENSPEWVETVDQMFRQAVESGGKKLFDYLGIDAAEFGKVGTVDLFKDKGIQESLAAREKQRVSETAIDQKTAKEKEEYLANVWRTKGQFVGGSNPGRYKNPALGTVKNYYDKVIKPAADAAGVKVSMDVPPGKKKPVFKIYREVEKGEYSWESVTGGVKKGGDYVPTFMKAEFISKDGNVINIKDQSFKDAIEKQHLDADISWNSMIDQFNWYSDSYHQGSMPNFEIAVWAKNLQNDMGGALRGAARVNEIFLPLEGERYITDKDISGENTRYEHNPPADYMLDALSEVFFGTKYITEIKFENGTTKWELTPAGRKRLQELKEGYTVKIIDAKFDDVIKEVGLESEMPVGEDRYYNWRTMGDARMRAVINVDPNSKNFGKIRGKEWAEKAEQRIEEVKDKDIEVVTNSDVFNRSSMKDKSISEIIETTKEIDKSLDVAREINPKIKKARVFDFDDTVARTKSKVFATKEGKKKTLTAEEFAKQGEKLEAEGWKMDFSDFNKVVDGKKGPLFEVMKKMKEAAGERDMFILTARSKESAPAIKKFLDAMGIDIPLENITGLGNGSPFAKSEWLVKKAAEGYNDFYFADDASQNVKAVRDALEVIDVKSQTQQARINRSSVVMDRNFNEIIENKTGIEAFKEFSDAKAKVKGLKNQKKKFWIPASAEDFSGLLDWTLGKGSKGDAQREFYNEALYKPYSRATRSIATDRVNLMADFKKLKSELDVPKDLRKKTKGGYTKEQAVRVRLWEMTGEEIPGLSKTDRAELNRIIESDPKLQGFADQILSITKGDGYSKPGEFWLSGTITTDLINLLNTTKRGKYLTEWSANVDVIFSKKNLNKVEAAFGPKYREALENSLNRMKSGKNRTEGGNKLSNKVLDYINNSQGVIMFLNTRSALLQTISAANFINIGFNNPLKAGKAFANQKQYWKDFMTIMNSDYLLDRRNGLKINISESEIADAASSSKNKAKAAVNYILEKGYLPTKFADSFAIASGGATFYRNRIIDLKKKGMSTAEAEKQAFDEFYELSEKSQQSSDPSKISQQQASDLGRIVLQFVNTPMQYARLQKADAKDLINGRGDPKTKIARIIYYGAMQNLFFNMLQNAMFKIGFDDDMGDAEIEDKTLNTINGSVDSILRGLGMGGVTVSVLKNLLLDINKRSDRARPEYQDVAMKLLEFSPAIKSKFSKFKSAGWTFDSKDRRAEIQEKGFSLDNPAYTAAAKVISGVTNIPIDRAFQKIENIKAVVADDTEMWQAIAMVLGWSEWQIKDEFRQAAKPAEAERAYEYKKLMATKADLDAYEKEQEAVKIKKEDIEYKMDHKKEFDMTKSAQVDLLKSLGVSAGRINSLKYEKDRIKLIIKLQEDPDAGKNENLTDKEKLENYKVDNAKFFKLTKPEQVRKLDSLGLSKAEIRALAKEMDRVKKLTELMEK